jgi:hypothetical protein
LPQATFGIEDALAGGRSGSQWFFAEHWLVGCDRRQNVFFVGRTDGGHDDGIHTLCCDDVLPSALGPAAKVLGNLLGSCRIDIGHCHHTRPGQRVGDTADMILSNVSGSDNSDIDRHFGKANFVFIIFETSLKGVLPRREHVQDTGIKQTSNVCFFAAAI